MEKVYTFGHKKPDTDSVTAAIALAYLKQRQGINAEAKVLGRLNNETKYVLKYFDVKCPDFLNDVKPQIRDVNYNKTVISSNSSIEECYMLLKRNSFSGCPVIDDNNKLCGMITLNDISSYLITGDYYKIKTSYNNLLKTLEAEEVLCFDKEIVGNVMAATYKSTTFISDVALDKDTILIVGDRHSIIEYAVNSSVKMIIVVGNGDIKEEHLEIARNNKVNIIRTGLDSFSTVKKINSSNYIENIIAARTPIKFSKYDYVSDFIETSKQTKHANYPIVDRKNNCLGFLRLVDASEKNKKKVILVDHNEFNQSVDGIEDAEIIEVVDHHKLGFFKTDSPISFRNMPVGSTNTIIYKMFEENQFIIPRQIAGIMLAGIISDTLLLKSPTTTKEDIYAVNSLSMIAGVDYNEFGMEMFKAGSSIKNKTLEEILFSDFKVFKADNIDFGIGEIFTTDYKELKLNIGDMVQVLNKVSVNNDYAIVCLFIVDIINMGSYIIYNDKAKNILEGSFGVDNLEQGYYFDGVMSRKKQIIPPILEFLDKK